jgi:hypothetical protein
MNSVHELGLGSLGEGAQVLMHSFIELSRCHFFSLNLLPGFGIM